MMSLFFPSVLSGSHLGRLDFKKTKKEEASKADEKGRRLFDERDSPLPLDSGRIPQIRTVILAALVLSVIFKYVSSFLWCSLTLNSGMTVYSLLKPSSVSPRSST